MALFEGGACDAVISCMASRTGVAEDAWAVDYQAHSQLLNAALAAGVKHFVLLSAICVQKPRLAFQQAKLAFEQELRSSGMRYSIVRPTAYFKSLSGQVQRVMQGRSYLLFGDGRQTACKPISDRDLANYLVACLEDPARQNQTLPIGGPGPAITPREQGEQLFALAAKPVRFTQVSPRLLSAIASALGAVAHIFPRLKAKAELARIGHYYATESMLVWDDAAGQYDASATPSTGQDRLYDLYAWLIAEGASVERGTHKVF
jgi:divinyl chlorophyllide a 8-vinyl-reductase